MELIKTYEFDFHIGVKAYPINGILSYLYDPKGNNVVKVCEWGLMPICEIIGVSDVFENNYGEIRSKISIPSGWNWVKRKSNYIQAHICRENYCWVNNKKLEVSHPIGLAVHKKELAVVSKNNYKHILSLWKL